MISGPTETPSDWMIASTPVSARFTVAISSASPAIFSSLGWSTRILRADRASARTECPALRAAFTVSSPIPLLAPMIRTFATTSCSRSARLAHRHVRCRQLYCKDGRAASELVREPPSDIRSPRSRPRHSRCPWALAECAHTIRKRVKRCTAEEANNRQRLLLRARRERPSRRAADERDELAPPHSITSSARASKVVGTSRPIALAALRLITSSYLVGACTGRSAGFWPLRIRSTYWAAERNWLARSDPYDIRPPALTK